MPLTPGAPLASIDASGCNGSSGKSPGDGGGLDDSSEDSSSGSSGGSSGVVVVFADALGVGLRHDCGIDDTGPELFGGGGLGACNNVDIGGAALSGMAVPNILGGTPRSPSMLSGVCPTTLVGVLRTVSISWITPPESVGIHTSP